MAVSFYFRNFANGSEHKGLSAFSVKFPSSAAGLHLVLKASCLRKKSCLVRYRMVECFHAITIDAKHLHVRCEQYCIILPSRNKSFSWNPFKFLHIWESLVSRSSRLDTRDSILERFEHRGLRIESRGSSFSSTPVIFKATSKFFGSQGCPDEKNWLDFSSIFFKICRFRSSILLSPFNKEQSLRQVWQWRDFSRPITILCYA